RWTARHVISSEARNLLLSTIQSLRKADSSSFLLGMTVFEHALFEAEDLLNVEGDCVGSNTLNLQLSLDSLFHLRLSVLSALICVLS
ncbi:MAG: hypothetical protein Q7N50_14945, partial [Armatimonadota bacterium]|nr:hypothetical protein [Armatimonadota bacterium]